MIILQCFFDTEINLISTNRFSWCLCYFYLLWESYTRYTRNNKTRHNRITANEAESTQCKQWTPKT